MKTKIIFIIAACFLAGQLSIKAQNQEAQRPNPEQMVQMATDRMVRELALDDATTAKFSELYKAYMIDKMAITREYRSMRGERPQAPETSQGEKKGRKPAVQNEESAAEQIIKGFERRQKNIELDQKLLNLDIQYCEKFNKVLNPKQILKLYQNQNNFGRPQGGQFSPNNGRPQPRDFQGRRPGGQGGWGDDQGDWGDQQ